MTDLPEHLTILLSKAEAIKATKGLRDAQLKMAINCMFTMQRGAESVGRLSKLLRIPRFANRSQRIVIARSGLFDWGYYCAGNPGLLNSWIHPIDHYLDGLAAEHSNPHPLFDGQWYLKKYPDVARSGMNPLYHYVCFGALEKRLPHPLFDTQFYLSLYPDVVSAGINPLLHYIRHGGLEGRQPHQLFNGQHYLQEFPQLHELGMTPLEHYCRYGALLPYQPTPYFDADSYLVARQELLVSGISPLMHFVSSLSSEQEVCNLDQLLQLALTSVTEPILPAVVAADAPLPSQNLQDFLYDEFGLEERTHIVSGMQHFRLPMNPERREIDLRTDDLVQLADYVAQLAATMPVSHTPDVSIIVPVYNQVRFTLACLYSVLAHKTRYSYEIIVADDCSNDATQDFFTHGLPNIHHVRPASNLGFLRNCNAAACEARGRVLVFLNNDTYVLPGWLNELVGALDADASIGLAGSKLIFSDGRLQEAGGLVFEDGSGWNYGRFDDPRKPEYCCLRDSDYVSGASIAIPADIWNQLGGFDECYEMAYYEDTDLAFRVRMAGKRVVVQSLSQLIHFEGISSGTDITAGIKRYQVVNGETFRQRWALTLASHGVADRDNLPTHRGNKGTILVIDARTPTPDRDSGSMDTFQYLRILKSFGYHVLFVPENMAHVGHYSANLQRIGVQVLYAPFWMNMEQVLVAHGPRLDHLLVYRAPVAEAVYDLVRRHAPQAKIIFDTVDLHFLRIEREAELAGDKKLKHTAKRLKKIELNLIRKADATIVLSRFEMELLKGLTPNAKLFEIPIVREVPAASPNGFEQRRDIVFVGGFEHQPNVDAVQWFVAEVMPLLQESGFAGQFVVVGSNMPAHIKALERPGIVMRGFVQDLEEFFSEIRLSVAPLRYGAGLKGKVISSLSYGVPVVATSVAVEGGGFKDGENVVVADEPGQMSAAIMQLYAHPELWNRQARAGRQFFIDNFSVETVTGMLGRLFEHLSNK